MQVLSLYIIEEIINYLGLKQLSRLQCRGKIVPSLFSVALAL